MSFETAFLSRIVNDDVAGPLHAEWAGTRAVHWDERPEGAPLPATVLTLVDDGTDYIQSGRDGLRFVTVQADHMAETIEQARAMADAISAMIETGAVVDGVTFYPSQVNLVRGIPVVGVSGARSVFGRTSRMTITIKE